MDSNKPLSLKLWGSIALSTIVLTLLFYIFLLPTPPPSDAFILHNAPRLNTFANEKNKLKVIMLGDSWLRYSTYNDKKMGELLSSKTNTDVSIVRLVNNMAVFDDFSYLTQPILDSNPDLIILQDTLTRKQRLTFINKALARKHLFWRYFGSGLWDPGKQNQHKIQNEALCSVLNPKQTAAERKKRNSRMYNFKLTGKSKSNLMNFLNDAKKRSIPVMFISIPITKRVLEERAYPSIEEEYSSIIPMMAFSDEHFCDLVHMNTEGRIIYSNWLSKKIAQQLKQGTSSALKVTL